MMKSEGFTKIETKLAWLRLTNLKPSSRHILYVEAVGEKASSLPSETLVAWTDPALPAFVDVISWEFSSLCLLMKYTNENLSSTATYSASGGQHSRGRFDDYSVSGPGQPGTHNIPLRGRSSGASGHFSAHGDGHSQHLGWHGACLVLCGQRIWSSHAGHPTRQHLL